MCENLFLPQQELPDFYQYIDIESRMAEVKFLHHDLFVSKNKNWLERELIFDCAVSNVDQSQSATAVDVVDSTCADNETNVDSTGNVCEEEPVTAPEANQILNAHIKKRRIVAAEYRSRKRRRVVKSVKKSNVSNLKPFDQCSRRTKRRRCVKMSGEMGENQLSAMYLSYLQSIDMSNEAKIVKKLRSASPNRKAKILAMLDDGVEILPYTANEALALMMDTQLSTHQYSIIQQQAKARNANIYPPYYKVLEAKKLCYPTKDSITVTDTGVNIDLQGLLDHTSARLMQSIQEPHNADCLDLEVRYKWGYDGASGQSTYKQLFRRADSSDKSVLMTSLVPLQVKSGPTVIWLNPAPSSTRYCRPISFEFEKETKERNIELWNFIKNQIDLLEPSALLVNGKNYSATHKLELTMVDGKVVDHLTETSSSNCNICGSKPTQMNGLEGLKKLGINENHFQFGLSTLHCWIRFMECVLHIAYRLEIARTDARGPDKGTVKDRKTKIQDDFKEQTGLLLDFVKTGAGTTNDGNTARRFFKNPKLSAEITGVDETLIDRFRVILTCLSSGKHINIKKFSEYTNATAKLFVKLFDWYKMPPSVHKVLIHGADIINSLVLPIGVYSEEASESRNKDFKNIREHHTRKMSRVLTNEDLIHGLLVSSDPLISSLRTPFLKPNQEFGSDVLDLLEL
ncbi:uncharacterized protein LOC119066024 [Bradysia coprophila]|uniref:uncharacterized protein LOC119066024 n=1 Tax=Bradysia coprophila TaxID=38358 RepID=UPI00187DD7DC|nr:uncharacterized protein LOC119066024 [Bradysia coprophila]